MLRNFDMWLLWRFQHTLNFLGRKFGVTKQGVVHSSLFWFTISNIMAVVFLIPENVWGRAIVIGLMIPMTVIFCVWIGLGALNACKDNEAAARFFYGWLWCRLFWFFILPFDLTLILIHTLAADWTLWDIAPATDLLTSFTVLYFGSCIEPPNKEKKEQLKESFV